MHAFIHVVTQVEFLHESRYLIPPHGPEVDEIVAESFRLLKDTRHAACMEGVLLLVNCLPTGYTGYEKMLPQWIQIWGSISFNSNWDVCWLTLFTRARKFAKQSSPSPGVAAAAAAAAAAAGGFDWQSLLPVLCTKAHELLQLPSVKGRSPQGSGFPHAVPGYYAKLITISIHSRQMALNKLAKLLYFCSTICPMTLLSSPTASVATVRTDPITITPPKLGTLTEIPEIPGFNTSADILPLAAETALFFQSLRTFLYPSNTGGWTQYLAYFVKTFVDEIAKHLGRSVATTVLEKSGAAPAPTVFTYPIHYPTIKYMCGLLTVISMEGK